MSFVEPKETVTYYHATPSTNIPSILRRGIRAAKGAWGQSYSSPRVYLSDDTNASYVVAGEMIVYHDVPEVSVLQISIPHKLERLLKLDPDWRGDHAAYYLERSIPASMIRRIVDRWTREDYDP